MFSFERRWLLNTWAAILPSDAGMPIGAEDAPLDGFIRDLEATAPKMVLIGLRAAACVVTLAGAPLSGRWARFGALDRAEQATVLQRLSESRFFIVREIPMLLKMFACLGYGALPEVQRAVGGPGGQSEPPAWTQAS